MAGPLSNPSAPTNPPGPSTPVSRKVGGSVRRTSPAPTGPTKGRAVTMSGQGTEGGAPEAGREAQDAARGTVHGQPRSSYNAGNNTSPIPNRGS